MLPYSHQLSLEPQETQRNLRSVYRRLGPQKVLDEHVSTVALFLYENLEG